MDTVLRYYQFLFYIDHNEKFKLFILDKENAKKTVVVKKNAY